jgi:hypothetical protein
MDGILVQARPVGSCALTRGLLAVRVTAEKVASDTVDALSI